MIPDYELHEKTMEVNLTMVNKPEGNVYERIKWLVTQRRTWAAVCSLLAMLSLNMGYNGVATAFGAGAAIAAGRSLQKPR